MKQLLLVLAATYLLTFFSVTAHADGCYLCEGGGYVKYECDETFEKRHQAQEKYGCKVSGTTSTCSHDKGVVSCTETEKSKEKK